MKQDSTAVPQTFVAFSCDNHAVSGIFSCSTPDELAEHLSTHSSFFNFSDCLYWGRVARRVFRGRVVFLDAHGSGTLLLRARSLLTMKESDGRLVQCATDTWTLSEHEAALADFETAAVS